VQMDGERVAVEDLTPMDSLHSLVRKAEALLGAERLGYATLCLDGSPFQKSDEAATLQDLGIVDGSELLCALRPAVFELQPGAKIRISGAGSESVNGTYTAVQQPSRILFEHDERIARRVWKGSYYMHSEVPRHQIAWFDAAGSWPAGWYIDSSNHRGMYFQPSYLKTCVPLERWAVYSGTHSEPGVLPEPNVDVIWEPDDNTLHENV